MAASVLRVGAKLGIASGAMYFTLDEGVWSSGNFGSKALDRVRTNVLPTANDMLNKLPTSENIGDTMVTSWNKGVTATFNTLIDSPQYIVTYGEKGLDYVKEKMK